MSTIVAFYGLEATDALGRWLKDIWQWDYEELEDVHNHIQFLFPNRLPGIFRAPLLDEETITAFRRDEALRDNLARSHDQMLDFYGLKHWSVSAEIVPAEHFAERAHNWLNPHNHNHLRITRILLCLMALGLSARAAAFFGCLAQLRERYPGAISEETFADWQDTVEPEV